MWGIRDKTWDSRCYIQYVRWYKKHTKWDITFKMTNEIRNETCVMRLDVEIRHGRWEIKSLDMRWDIRWFIKHD